jgi:hypothetical protein
MESIKDYTIAVTFILVTSVALLFWVLNYPTLNGQDSILLQDQKFNDTANDLAISLGTYQSEVNTDINISTSDQPQVSAESLQLVSTTAVSRNILSRTLNSFKLLTTFLGNIFGLSGSTFAYISGALISLIGVVVLYLSIKFIRQGY